jgi:hypothetical protein
MEDLKKIIASNCTAPAISKSLIRKIKMKRRRK